ncbi:MAG: pyruvate ferredoxin oxidoreductase [Candidatus Aenigmarchaeota archaeon ex4484_14]|nr:MAG: pyruvate ferredoxin oxidoreductase [Candidatus Aenigmarchaeota archaeon ex4484_14]
MFTIRIHGRAGQGCHKAAKIIGRAAFLSGYYVQDSVVYGPERRGAPVESFVRIDNKPITERGFIINPDFILIFDDSLEYKTILQDCSESMLIINTKMPKKKFQKFVKSISVIDANDLSKEILGETLPNTMMLGALVKKFNKLSLKVIEKAIDIEIGELKTENKEALHQGYKKVR